MNPDATRNLLIRRRELTGESFNDHTIQSWQDLLKGADYRDAVEALNTAATQHERVNARHLHEHLPGNTRPARQPTVGMPDCLECEAVGFSGFVDNYGTRRMAPCATCRPDDHAKWMKLDRDNDHGPPVQFACMQSDALAGRSRAWANRTAPEENR
jgi:hypothetical protein